MGATAPTLQKRDDPAPLPDGRPSDHPDEGDTRVAQSDQSTEQSSPRLPHERDQSADSQPRHSHAARQQGEQAHDDATSGQQDTDRAPVTDQVYREQQKP